MRKVDPTYIAIGAMIFMVLLAWLGWIATSAAGFPDFVQAETYLRD